jgi:DNA replication protein DnaC
MKPSDELPAYLTELQLQWPLANYESLAEQAARENWTRADYLRRLLEGECQRRRDVRIQRRIQAARFPVIKTLETLHWNWPKKINRSQARNLFRLKFLEDHANVIFLGGVGVGKTHLATALGYAACLEGRSVLFASTVDVINSLLAAQAVCRSKVELKKYLAPHLRVLDEIGCLPIDKAGADLLFEVVGQRCERGSLILTTNKAFKQWPWVFNNDTSLTSALLDRLLHHAETVVIEGSSYRMKDQLAP